MTSSHWLFQIIPLTLSVLGYVFLFFSFQEKWQRRLGLLVLVQSLWLPATWHYYGHVCFRKIRAPRQNEYPPRSAAHVCSNCVTPALLGFLPVLRLWGECFDSSWSNEPLWEHSRHFSVKPERYEKRTLQEMPFPDNFGYCASWGNRSIVCVRIDGFIRFKSTK